LCLEIFFFFTFTLVYMDFERPYDIFMLFLKFFNKKNCWCVLHTSKRIIFAPYKLHVCYHSCFFFFFFFQQVKCIIVFFFGFSLRVFNFLFHFYFFYRSFVFFLFSHSSIIFCMFCFFILVLFLLTFLLKFF
jgi:hypothetical protein